MRGPTADPRAAEKPGGAGSAAGTAADSTAARGDATGPISAATVEPAAEVRSDHTAHTGPASPGPERADPRVPYGLAGRPFDRQSPFYFGFLATIGALVAWTLFQLVGRLTTMMTILAVALFLTLALNPMVERLLTRGVRRSVAVIAVFSGVIVTTVLVAMLVVPPVISEGTALLGQVPEYFTRVLQSPWLQRLDADYQVVERAQEEFTKRIQDGSLVAQIFGGVLGAGRAVVNGVFQVLTILILTLYFLATLPRIKHAAYAAVPASRRPRIVSLSEEIMRRTGAYAAGQGLVATINALCSYIMMTIVGIPYAAVLAVVVGLFGLIPMVGAAIGAVVVGIIAFFYEPRMALIVAVYYIVYQQIENYVIVPRIMTSTVSVPGAVTIVAALAGGTLLGVVGALLAIPVAAGLLLLYEEVLLPRQRQH
ncbi:AI-2E family transporter [Nostocoides sp. F2B08]|nr:AI-2E family transporter [Tetrasphaera sp. F2B08]